MHNEVALWDSETKYCLSIALFFVCAAVHDQMVQVMFSFRPVYNEIRSGFLSSFKNMDLSGSFTLFRAMYYIFCS